MPTYLVTGAAGFIAAKVCEMLLADGHTVVGVDNLNDYYDVRLKDHRLSGLLGGIGKGRGTDPKKSVYCSEPAAPGFLPPAHSSGRFTFYHLDVEDLPALEKVFQAHRFAAVFNLAARAGVRASLEQPELYRRANVIGEENVLKCQVKFGVKKHVLASSSSVYAGCPMPFSEELAVDSPQSPYAATKLQAERLAFDYHESKGVDASVLRYFTVFGPAGRPDMAPFRFVKWIAEGTPITLYGDGTQTRDFTYIDDIARGTILAAKPVGFERINLGGGNRPFSINVMIASIERQLGKKAIVDRHPRNPADMTDTAADISKAQRILGWTPEITPEDGFQKVVDWYTRNRDWLKSINL